MSETTIREARAEDQDALTALWATAFTPALAPDQWLVDDERLRHTLVASDEAGLYGSIYGLPKRLREEDGGVARVHAIGSVAVAERARGRGLARRLVAATLHAAGDADWALLFTGTPEVYRSSGFETFSMPRTLSGPWSPVLDASSDAVVRGTVGDGSLAPLRAEYERSRDGRLVLAPVRDDRDWAMAEVRMRGASLYRFADAATGGSVIAEVQGDVGMLLEVAVPATDDGARALRGLLAAVTVDWASAGVRSCDLAVPALAEEESAVRDFAPEAVRHDDHTGMIRPLQRAARLHGIRHFTAGDYF